MTATTKTQTVKKEQKPTPAQFTAYQKLFDFFNARLFNNELPQCILNLSRMAKAHGFFAPSRWESTEPGKVLHEISLNPDSIARKPREVMGTFVHEMCHLWQQELGKAPRRAYHDKQFAEIMERVGLITSTDGTPGGKRTGQNMTHYILENGPFDKAFDLIPAHIFLPFKAVQVIQGIKEPKKANKIKYTCPECGCNAWGKPELNLICGDCFEAANDPESENHPAPVYMQPADLEG